MLGNSQVSLEEKRVMRLLQELAATIDNQEMGWRRGRPGGLFCSNWQLFLVTNW
jgi:hypothetical protein